ncbi:MAG: Ldh family oxidoreductase [Chloroflexia bacterium]|nr:Ldh family oxidoreductase [Chloroflexia bacterium]
MSEATVSSDPWAGVSRFAEERLVAFAAAALVASGLGTDEARRAADFLLIADRRGIDSHGVARLPGFVRRLRANLIDPDATLTVDRETPVTVALNANNGLGLLLAPAAMERCIAKAEATGICLATVRQSNHFGIAGAYALMAAERGLGGLAMTNASPLVVPVFGATAMLGTNPLAFAVPTGGRPFVLDMSTSTVAWGKIEIARRAGLPIPRGWGVTDDGEPTTDPAQVKWLLPLGGERATSGQKGYGLGLMVDIFCGLLSGGATSGHVARATDTGRSQGTGHTFLAWRIDAFRDEAEFRTEIDGLIAELRATPAAPGHEGTGVLVPGDPEADAEARNRRDGIPVRPEVLAELHTLASEIDVPFTLDPSGE